MDPGSTWSNFLKSKNTEFNIKECPPNVKRGYFLGFSLRNNAINFPFPVAMHISWDSGGKSSWMCSLYFTVLNSALAPNILFFLVSVLFDQVPRANFTVFSIPVRVTELLQHVSQAWIACQFLLSLLGISGTYFSLLSNNPVLSLRIFYLVLRTIN